MLDLRLELIAFNLEELAIVEITGHEFLHWFRQVHGCKHVLHFG